MASWTVVQMVVVQTCERAGDAGEILGYTVVRETRAFRSSNSAAHYVLHPEKHFK